MISQVLIVLCFLSIAAFEVPKLVRDKLWREVWVVVGLLVVGLVISIFISLDIRIPVPPLPIK